MVIFSGVVECGAMIVDAALKKFVMSELLTALFCATKVGHRARGQRHLALAGDEKLIRQLDCYSQE
jgi:hypothetical protein